MTCGWPHGWTIQSQLLCEYEWVLACESVIQHHALLLLSPHQLLDLLGQIPGPDLTPMGRKTIRRGASTSPGNTLSREVIQPAARFPIGSIQRCTVDFIKVWLVPPSSWSHKLKSQALSPTGLRNGGYFKLCLPAFVILKDGKGYVESVSLFSLNKTLREPGENVLFFFF